MEKKQEITTLSEPMALGEIFMQSGMFTDIKTQAQAVVKILAGRELGLAPLESMTNIYIVNGKVALQAKIIGSLIKKSKKYDYTVKKLDDKECVIDFFQIDNKGERTHLGESSFTFQDAAKAGLVNKDVWKSYPRNMLFARSLSNGARWYASDVFSGYTPEEVEEEPKTTKLITITADGEVTEDDKKSETPVSE
jgi:hypothetical protein